MMHPPTSRTPRALLVTLVTLGVLASGCGGADDSPKASSSATATRSGGDSMAGMDMSVSEGDGPSKTATIVCEEDEVRDAVKRTFAMTSDPTSTHTWSQADRMFSCRWKIPHGTLKMSVQDAVDPAKGRTYFEDLRARSTGATAIRGVEGLGFPNFTTRSGEVSFLKDGKTLLVDASDLPDSALPKQFSRSDVAYSVAAAVIACWTE